MQIRTPPIFDEALIKVGQYAKIQEREALRRVAVSK